MYLYVDLKSLLQLIFLRWTWTLLFRSDDRSTSTVNGDLKLSIVLALLYSCTNIIFYAVKTQTLIELIFYILSKRWMEVYRFKKHILHGSYWPPLHFSVCIWHYLSVFSNLNAYYLCNAQECHVQETNFHKTKFLLTCSLASYDILIMRYK